MNILNTKTIDQDKNPKDITTIRKLFQIYGIEEYEESTLNCINEFINSHITDILTQAKKNMNIAKRTKLDIRDLEVAVINQQNHMYRSKTLIQEMKYLVDKVNNVNLPQIPESPLVLKPPIHNNLLRNNFQIYSEDLNKILMEKKALDDSLLKSDDGNLLGNKRNLNDNTGLNPKNRKEQKNKRKKSISQEHRKVSPDNSNNKKGLNLIEKNNENKKGTSSKKNYSSLSDDDDLISDDFDDPNNKNGESVSNNKKEEDDMKMEEDNEMKDDEDNSEDEELEGDEDDNDGNENS